MKRIIVILFAVMSLLSAGTAYAFTDNGERLLQWSHALFLKSSKEIGTVTANKFIDGIQQLSKDVNGAVIQTQSQIKGYQEEKVANAEKEIIKQKAQYIQELRDSTELIKQQHAEKVKTYRDQVKAREQIQLTNDTEQMLTEVLKEQK